MHHIFSSIWPDITHSFLFLEEHSRWQVGNEKNIDLWTENWLE